MSIALYCVLVAGLLPYVGTIFAKVGTFQPKDNAAPREFLERQTGYRKRANWAQLNAFEAFPFFAAAVIIATIRGADAQWVDRLAIGFVVARVLHVTFYLLGKGPFRTLAFTAGIGCVIALFFV